MATDYTISVSVRNKTTNDQFSSTATLTGGDAVDSGIWKVTTGEVSHTINTDITNCMGVAVENLDAANFVEIGVATADYDHKLLAGMPAFIPLESATATLYMAADTATVNVRYMIIEAP